MAVTEDELKKMCKGYFSIPKIKDEGLLEYFPYFNANDIREHPSYAMYLANRTMYVCHNCGVVSHKYDSVNPLFRCYSCRSSNVSLVRAGELSILVRSSNIGINMLDIKRARKELVKRRRKEKKERTKHLAESVSVEVSNDPPGGNIIYPNQEFTFITPSFTTILPGNDMESSINNTTTAADFINPNVGRDEDAEE